jgi:hypothetical protein
MPIPPAIAAEPHPQHSEKPQPDLEGDSHPLSSNIIEGPFTCTTMPRRNSAFSFYDPHPKPSPNGPDKCSSTVSFSEAEQYPKRTWKHEKKDKRELNRLETKNLNRYFRSKINELLRDIKENPRDQEECRKADEVLELLNKSNKIMFSEIREIIKDKWLQERLLSCSGVLLKYIHGGKMGMQSKLTMLKYFNKILKAIRNPENFTCWK